jgi:type VI secretion system protein ImpC
MEQVAAIKDIGNYFDRAEYIKWKSFRETDDSRYLGLVMPRVLGRLPYGPDTVPVRSFNYVEEVKGPDHDKYLWTNASFAFAANMVKSFINNGWCVQTVARRPVVPSRTCQSICMTSAPATR